MFRRRSIAAALLGVVLVVSATAAAAPLGTGSSPQKDGVYVSPPWPKTSATYKMTVIVDAKTKVIAMKGSIKLIESRGRAYIGWSCPDAASGCSADLKIVNGSFKGSGGIWLRKAGDPWEPRWGITGHFVSVAGVAVATKAVIRIDDKHGCGTFPETTLTLKPRRT
jgi:hypothetical protein